jgi:hypothetical protein
VANIARITSIFSSTTPASVSVGIAGLITCNCSSRRPFQHHLTIILALGHGAVVGDVVTWRVLVTLLLKSAEEKLFQLVFGDHGSKSRRVDLIEHQ